MREELTQERLRELLHYDPETGVFTWNKRVGQRVLGGARAGSVGSHGYLLIQVKGISYRAHRLAFLYMLGKPPDGEVDHINGERLDNRWTNLREASRSENQRNTGPRHDNTSGYKGVGFHKGREMFQAQIKIDGRNIHLGYFLCPRKAAHAYNKAAIQLHGEFAVLNPI